MFTGGWLTSHVIAWIWDEIVVLSCLTNYNEITVAFKYG